MIERKRLTTVGGTLICALGIGYFMQSTAQPPAAMQKQVAAKPAAEKPEVNQQQALAPVKESNAIGEIKEITLTAAAPVLPKAPSPAVLPGHPVVKVALDDVPVVQMPEEVPAPSLSCEHQLTARSEAAAMVRLQLDAPCMINERFTLHHNGMMFTQVTDSDGQSDFTVPALSKNAVFIVAFANGEGAVANASVSSLEYYDRAVLQWKGESGMQIHALEYGSDYGSDGHVWADAARDNSVAALGEGGFLTRLGAADVDNALLAEVYTFPTGVAKRGGDVQLSVEAEVSGMNCGRDVEAQSIQKGADGGLKTQDLVLAMPDCNAIGDFLVLKNLLNDLKIASK